MDLKDEFENNEREYDTVIIPGPFSANTKFRFRCDASGTQDWVYIDEVDIAGCTFSDKETMISNSVTEEAILTAGFTNRELDKQEELQLKLYPKPVVEGDYLYLDIDAPKLVQEIHFLNISGRVVQIVKRDKIKSTTKISSLGLATGMHIIRLIKEDKNIVKQVLVVK
jgi:hypothetical protein